MSIIEENVTEFKALGTDSYQRAVGALGAVAMRAGSMIEGLMRQVNPLNAALASIGGAYTMAGLIEVNSAFDDTQTRMAGTLASLQIAPNFTEGLNAARVVIDNINTAAAALPGEAEDYVAVFTETLPNVGRAIGGNLEKVTNFTNRYVAVMSSLRIPVSEQAMTLNRALSAGKGSLDQQSGASRLLIQQIATLHGQQDLTIAKFNTMGQAARSGLLQQALFSSAMNDMLDYASSRWAAVIGSVQTTSSMLFRLSTARVFNGMTDALSTINSAFVDANGHLTHFGQSIVTVGSTIGSHITDAISSAASRFKAFSEDFDGFLARLQQSPAIRLLDSLFARGQAMASALMSGGREEGGGGAQGTAVGASVGMLIAGPLGALAGLAVGVDGVVQVLMALGQGLGQLYDAIAPAAQALGGMLTPVVLQVVDVAVGLIPIVVSVVEVLGVVVEALAPFVSLIVQAAGMLAGLVIPVVRAVADGLVYWKDQIQATVSVLAGALGALTLAAVALCVPLSPLIVATGALVLAFAAAVRFFNGNKYDVATERGLNPAKPVGAVSGALGKLMESLQATSTVGGKSLADFKVQDFKKTPGERSGNKTVQDFRNSRFTIQQSFAENFDPDRIAVAFAKDIQKIGEQRLQSGFEPLFGVV